MLEKRKEFEDWPISDLVGYATLSSTICNVLDVVEGYVGEDVFKKILVDVCVFGDGEVKY